MNDSELSSDTEDFAQSVADSFSSFLLALRAIAREGDVGRAISLLLLEISQISLAGARLGAQQDFEPRVEYQPDVGPEADLDDMRMRLAEMLDNLDTYSYVFDPYVPEVVESQLSDDLTSIAADLENVPALYNGELAFVSLRGEQPIAVWTLDIAADGIRGFYNVMNPAKLSRIEVPSGQSG